MTEKKKKTETKDEAVVKKAPAAKKSPAEKKPAAPKKAAAAPKKAAAAKKTSKPKTSSLKKSIPKEPVLSIAKDSLTEEEKARLAQLKETVKRLHEDPEWLSFLEEQTDLLLSLRSDLVPNMASVTKEHLRSGASNESSSSGQHIGDAGSDAEVRDLTIRLLDKDRELLFEIDAALNRIKRGVYGVCEISLMPIPKGRLRVRPYCRLTVKCQEEFEKEHGSASLYRAPASDIFGYAGGKNDEENNISLDDDEE